ncbi:unnamed protein product [Ceratitis capitata]|uniref:(Mediterranean fruit fly) hypothetical protein n=1 Tax=Ceratitis capitata TaxID=7213 RepID=A0A811UGB3_CERCA|nr:unnamed protein product [Ceratitis capitata]
MDEKFDNVYWCYSGQQAVDFLKVFHNFCFAQNFSERADATQAAQNQTLSHTTQYNKVDIHQPGVADDADEFLLDYKTQLGGATRSESLPAVATFVFMSTQTSEYGCPHGCRIPKPAEPTRPKEKMLKNIRILTGFRNEELRNCKVL